MSEKRPPPEPPRYRVLTGFNTPKTLGEPDEVRFEPGETHRGDLFPEHLDLQALIALGVLEEVSRG